MKNVIDLAPELDDYLAEFHEAMVRAFTLPELKLLLQFKLDLILDDEVGPGAGRARVLELLNLLASDGRLTELFNAALGKKPGNPKLRALLQRIAQDTQQRHNAVIDTVQTRQLDFRSDSSLDADPVREAFKPLVSEQSTGLQALAVAATSLNTGLSVADWLQRQQQVFKNVCLIRQAGEADRTGLLVGPDRVITCSHSLNIDCISTYDCVFDYHRDTDRDTLPGNAVAEVLISSPVSELDFAILRLKQPTEGRGFFCIQPQQFNTHREPLIVVGHPSGNALRPTVGVLMDNNDQAQRIAYSANTEPGSSGSAVLTNDYALVALHHHGQQNMNNHGIPFRAILSYCAEKGLPDLLQTCT